MKHRNHRLRIVQFLTALIVLSGVEAGLAQSGRRATGTSTTTPSVSGPKTVEKKPAYVPRLMLLVGIEDRNTFSNIPYYLADTVLDNCVRRLGDAENVTAIAAAHGMTRADAIRRAKAEREVYVVWLELAAEFQNTRKESKNGPDELYVRYTIFEPLTAKVKQSGRTHQQIYKTGRGGVSTTSKNSPLYSEYALKQAAREAAERVLEAFDIMLRAQRWR